MTKPKKIRRKLNVALVVRTGIRAGRRLPIRR